MKKKRWIKASATLAAAVALACSLYTSEADAKAPDVYGGIMNEYEYEEVVFITGQPVVFKGDSKAAKFTESEKNGKRTETHSLKLVNENGDELTRSFTYEFDTKSQTAVGQFTENGNVKSFKEEIVIDDVAYVLKDYQYSNSIWHDKLAANLYYSGNAEIRKIYETDVKKGEKAKRIDVYITSKNDGYENFWGATETKLTDAVYMHDDLGTFTVKSKVSNSKSKTFVYEESKPSLSNVPGGYLVATNADAISEYTYEVPNLKSTGTIQLNTEYSTRNERLAVPKFRDLATHWAKEDIEKLYSLGVYDDESNFFSPGTPMLRYDFAIAVAKAIDSRVELEPATKKNPTPKALFDDVAVPKTAKDRDQYAYFASIVEKGVIRGENGLFKPTNSLTRQQAAVIMIRALGMEHIAPDPGYQTSYADDARIADYARDGVYVAQELGIMMGDPATNMFNPYKPLTRAQASAIITRFLQYLEEDLQQNYRDDVLLFN
ncbi:MAG: S-layer homology domain-containing protein [Caryophanon sp.]|nr:S-layer homology domain-containing protein [Caryophanon sp.]